MSFQDSLTTESWQNLSGNGGNHSGPHMPPTGASMRSLVPLTLLFSIIGVIGVLGNTLVIYVILGDKKMRRSVTNLFILNLAVADLLIMLIGVPEIVQFIINHGWLLGQSLCKSNRYVLVCSLYVSIMSLVAVCVERYIAILHPIKAHIFCSRRRILASIAVVWPLGLILGLPAALYNQVTAPPGVPIQLCVIRLPYHPQLYPAYRFAEFALFFLSPVLVQSILYALICRRLFSSAKELHRKHAASDGTREKDSDAVKARKGVVKMLIASVLVYFISYAPAQIPLVQPKIVTWPFHVLLMTLGYINSAANPVLYAIFSQNFRRRFKTVCCPCLRNMDERQRRGSNMDSYAYRSTNLVRYSKPTIHTGYPSEL